MAGGGWLNTKLEKISVFYDMTQGGCIEEYETAREQCCSGKGSKFEEALLCAKATEALRKCMVGKEVLAEHLVAMDEGIKEEERRRMGADLELKQQDAAFRWWTGMRRSEEEEE